ncbi:TetR/AcrR family transcriptional regulator [Streptomyces sp. NBC_01716]|uniref:TetR/AcrR family transcriptional regulator n=1 Tax=Streptomyces sp. NBC_01716 TaxID=2975917 RepID=UPI002E3510CD|nr:TetR/AcrR family transcriptional regulator [Streptomyces sp. NBC_01716]
MEQDIAEATVRTSARDRLLDAADELFSRDGIALTSVDQVLHHAHVAPGTLYAHFSGKDGLIAAALRRRLDRWERIWQEAVDAAATPAEKLLALFDAVSTYRCLYTPGRGCAFLATSTELPDLDHPARAVITAESTLLLTRLNQLAETVTTDDPAALAGDVLLVYDGAMAGLLRGRTPDPLGHGRTLASRLIQNAIEAHQDRV